MTQKDSAKALIDLAEKAAAEAMDPEKFDFLAALEDKGIAMPKDMVKVFTNADLHSEILTLSAEQDAILKEQTAQDVETTEALRAERMTVLQREATEVVRRNEALEDDEEMADLASVPEEPEHVPTLTEIRQRAVEDVPEYHSAPSARITEIQAKLDELLPQAYAERLEIHFEGLQPKESQELSELIEEEMLKPMQAGLSDVEKGNYRAERHANELVARSITSIYNPKTGQTQDFSAKRMPAPAARRLLRVLPNSETEKILVVAQTLTYAAALIDLKTDAGFPGRRIEQKGKPVLGVVYQDSEGVG